MKSLVSLGPDRSAVNSHAYRMAELDGWRGLAILCVLAGHFSNVTAINLGRLGVELFFVLSGRLMAEILFVRQANLRVFFLRRFSRIFPVALLFLLVMISVAPSEGLLALSWQAALSAALMGANYATLWDIGAPVTNHYWSLSIEEHSYICLALISLLACRIGPKTLRGISLLCLGLASLMMVNGVRLTAEGADYYTTYWRTDVRAATIFASAGLFLLAKDLTVKLAFRSKWWLVVLLVGGVLMNTRFVPDPAKYTAGSLLLGLVLVLVHQLPDWALRALRLPMLRYLGTASFSLYIWQQPFHYLTQELGKGTGLVLAVTTGLLCHRFFEDPIRSWLNNRISLKYANTVA